ncbi:carboxypeptidase regulatory-like domain-containing protein [Ancylomarina sp.]|uniref:carboxypeptidase regulatory-like domain-containing protein n=1 Tax=Ancylomarina sp. TaxID=1970196 RepID=UPI0035651082
MKKVFLFLMLGALMSFTLQAQTGSVSGKVKSAKDGQFLERVQVQVLGTSNMVYTDADGQFSIVDIPAGKHLIELNQEGFISLTETIDVVEGKNTSVGTLVLEINKFLPSLDELDVMSITDDVIDADLGDMAVSGILSSSKDPFNSAAAYTFSSARFRRRGYGSEESGVFFNGIPMNNMENGRAYWFLWGGLNDVTRNQEVSDGLAPTNNGFGLFGGNTNIISRADTYRKGTKIVYSRSNRSYRNRTMITHSTGMMENGWALTGSVSKRWSEEGYIKGTSYDAYGYFLSALKKINEKHSIGLTVMGAPSTRGGSGASVQAAYDIVGSNYYNPNWGWQDGKKRNAKMQKSHTPVAILKHYWELNSKTKITTSLAYMNGESGRTALNWIDAADPRPDYYRNLAIYPANANNPEISNHFKANSQLNWDKMYEKNLYNNPDYIDADGTNHGKHARYMIEDRRRDVEQIIADVNVKHELNKNIQLVGGANYNSYKAHTYTLVDDLMGTDFIWNIDKFATRQDPAMILSNQERVDRVQNDYDYFEEHGEAQKLKEGDVYGHDYDAHVDKISGFAQANFSYDKFDYYASLGLTQTAMWRDSKVRKGLFKDNSYGESEKLYYFNYGVKAGVTYKKDGKNYFSANAGYMTKAPTFRNVFLSPRTRHTSLKDKGQNTDEKIMTVDLGYSYRSPNFKLKANAYYTKFQDQIKTMGFYHDESRTFVNSIQSGVDKTHMGIEIGFDYKLLDELSLIGAIAVGEHKYDSRPLLTMIADNEDQPVQDAVPVYVTDFKETGYPQQAYTVGLKYSSDNYWWVGVNANYYREMYLSYNPLRRTKAAFDRYKDVTDYSDDIESSDLFTGLLNKVTSQSKLDDQFTLDLNIGKSWRIDYKYYININLSVSNVLNNTDFITGGYEQSRIKTDSKYESEYDISQFPPKLYYAYGRNFFLNMSFRF